MTNAAPASREAERLQFTDGPYDLPPAAAFAQADVPSGMLLVRNQNGSHSPDEAMHMDDFATACRVLMRWVLNAT